MSDDSLKIQGEVSLDSTNAEKALGRVEQSAGRMAQKVAKSGEQAGQGLAAIGSGAEAATQKTEQSSGRFIAAMQRQVAAAAAGTKSSRAYFESLAQQRGISADVLKPYLDQLDQITAKQQAAARSNNFLDGLRGQLSALREQAIAQNQGADALLRYKAAQAGAAAEASHLITQLTNMRAAQDAAAEAAKREAQAQRDAAQARAARAGFVEGLRAEADAIGKTRSQLLELKAAQLGVSAEAAPLIARLKATEAATTGLGMSAKATTAAMRQVPMQMTDIVTSLAAGQAPFTVLIQQGGQLKDTLGGIGPAARALGGYVAGLITPLTVMAAGIGAVAFAAFQGSKELREFQNAAAISGNSLGLSSSGFAELRDNIAGIGVTKGKAVEALTEIAKAGVFTRESVQGIAQAAVLMEKATGQSISKTVDQFKELARSPAEASAKLNEQYNFLTAAIYRQIKALEELGLRQQAASLAEQTYADAMGKRARSVVENAGFIEVAWRGVEKVAKGAWDAMLNLGRDETGGEQLTRLRNTLADRLTRGPLNDKTSASFEKGNEALRQQITLLERLNGIQGQQSKAHAENNRLQQLGIDFLKRGDEFKSRELRREEELKRARAEGIELVRAGIIKQTELEGRLAAIREKYKDPGSASGQSEVAAIRAKIQAQEEYLAVLRVLGPEAEKLTDGEKRVLLLQNQLKTSITGKARAEKEAALALEVHSVGLEKMIRAILDRARAEEEANRARQQYTAGLVAGLDKVKEEVKAEQEYAERLGLSKAAVAELVAAKYDLAAANEELKLTSTVELDEFETNLAIRQAKAYRDLAAAKRATGARESQLEIDKAIIDSAKRAEEEWLRTNERIADSFVDNLMRGGKSVAQYLKDLFRTLVLRPLLQPAGNLLAGAANGLLGGGSAGMFGGVPTNGLIGGLTNNFGMGGIAGGLGAFSSAANATAQGVFLGAGELSSLGFGEALSGGLSAVLEGSFAAGFGTLAGVLGPIGIGLSLLSSVLSKDRGGPKTESAFNYFTQTGDPAAAKAIADTIVATYQNVAAQLGISAQALNLGVQFSKDPQGTAQTMLDVVAPGIYSRGGRLGTTENVGRSDAAFEAEVSAEMQRVIISALRGADLPAQFAAAVAGIDLSGSAEVLKKQIEDIVNAKGVIDSFKVLGEAFASVSSLSIEAAGNLATLFGGLQNMQAKTGSYYQNYYSEEEKRANLQQQVTAALGAQNLAMPATRDAYRALVEAQNLSTEAGRKNYAVLVGLSDVFAQLTPLTEAAVEVVEEASTALVDLAKSAADALSKMTAAAAGLASAKDALRNYGTQLQATVSNIEGQINQLRGQALQAVQTAASTVQNLLDTLQTAAASANAGVQQAVATAQQNLQALQSADDQAKAAVISARGALQGTLSAVATQIAQTAASIESAQDQVKAARAQIIAGYNAALSAQDQVKSRITDAYIGAQAEVTSAQQRLADLQRQAADALRAAGNSIIETLRDLAGTSAGSGNVFQQLSSQRNAFQALASRALAGDAAAAAQLGGAGKNLLTASRAGSSSFAQFQADDILVRSILGQVLGVTGSGGVGNTAQDQLAKAQADLQAATDKATAAQLLAVQSGAGLTKSNEDLASELARATIEVAKWSAAVTTSNATQEAAEADVLAQYNTAAAALAKAQDSQARLLEATASLDLSGSQVSADSWAAAVDAATAAQIAYDKAQQDATTSFTALSTALTDAAAFGVTLAQVKTPLETLRASLEAIAVAQGVAGIAAADLATALAAAAGLGVALEAAKTPLQQFDDAMVALLQAQVDAAAVDADLFNAGQGLVGQYLALQGNLSEANDALAEFALRTAGIDLSPLQTVLDGLLAQYNLARSESDAANAQAAFITSQINSTGYGASINAAYAQLLGRTADFGGLVYWFNQMMGGSTPEDIAAGIRNSPEYQNRVIAAMQPQSAVVQATTGLIGLQTAAANTSSTTAAIQSVSALATRFESQLDALNEIHAENKRMREILEDITGPGDGVVVYA